MNAVASQFPEQGSVFAATLLTKFVIVDFNRVSILPPPSVTQSPSFCFVFLLNSFSFY